MNIKKQLIRGFTIIELIVVIVIIGILSTIVFFTYTGIQARAHDTAVLSDIDSMDALQTSYGLKHGVAGKAYYSGNGPDSELGFTPTNGDVIDVVINATDYCIRGYNPKGTKNSMDNAFIKESTAGICSLLPPSVESTTTLDPPSTPAIAVTLNGANVLATITPVTCTTGTTQYGIRSHTNGGTWGGYSAWLTTTTATQVANDGVKYGYQAQAHCYVSDHVISATVTGTEGTYIDPIGAPATPTVAANTAGATTTFSWNAASCTSGTTARYQYRYTIAPSGYDSGWVATVASPFAATTSTEVQTYTVQVQAQCYNANATSGWSGIGTASYYRPITTYTLTTIAGAGGTVSAGGTYNTGTVQTITATPSTYYSFSSWTGSTGCSGVASHTITMDANKSCTANFTPTAIGTPTMTTVTTPTTGDTTTWSWGAVSCPGNTARYRYDYLIDSVSQAPAGWKTPTVPTATSINFTTVTEGHTYAVLVQAQCYNTVTSSAWSASSNTASWYHPITTYVLTTVAGAGGTVSAGGTYNTGTVQTITATPRGGYSFSSWSGDTGCSGVASHTIAMNANKSCTANFTFDGANWLAIGTQIWAKTNLNVGTMITGLYNQSPNGILEKYCYNNLESNCTTYGGLYQWDEATQYVSPVWLTEGTQGICPTGSHIPSDNDWKILEMQLGMSQAQADAIGWRGTNQGTQLKPSGTSGLNMPLAGYRYTDGSFVGLSGLAYLWSSSQSDSTNAWYHALNLGFASVYRVASGKGYGCSVRCLGN